MWQKFGLTKEFRRACGLPSMRTESMDRSLEHLILTENISFSGLVYWEIKSAFVLSALTITEYLHEQFPLSSRLFLEMSRRREMSFWKISQGHLSFGGADYENGGLSVSFRQQWKQMQRVQFYRQRQVFPAAPCCWWVTAMDVEETWTGSGKQAGALVTSCLSTPRKCSSSPQLLPQGNGNSADSRDFLLSVYSYCFLLSPCGGLKRNHRLPESYHLLFLWVLTEEEATENFQISSSELWETTRTASPTLN